MLRIEGVAPVHGAGVIPHERIARLPLVRVDKLRASGPVEQICQHLRAFFSIPTYNFCGHSGAQVQCFASRYRVRAHNWVMNIGRASFLFVVGRHAVSLIERFIGLIRQTPV